jgi:hypothetical protein
MEVNQGPNWGCSAKEKKFIHKYHLMISNRLSEGSQSRQTVILVYGHESRWTRNQESLCWRRPAEIFWTDDDDLDRKHVMDIFYFQFYLLVVLMATEVFYKVNGNKC